MRRWAVLAAVAAIGLCGASQPPAPRPAEAGDKPQNESAAEQHQAAGRERGTKAAPLIVEIPPTQDSKAEATEDARREQGSAMRDWWLVIFTGVLTAATVALGIFTYLLWSETKKAVADTAAGIKVATDTLAHAQLSSKRELRAYVNVSGARFDNAGTRAVILYKNFGLTPAYHVEIQAKGTVREHPLVSTLPGVVFEGTKDVLPPNGDPHTVEVLFAEWDDPNSRFGQGGTALYIHGVIKYRDAFKERHTTKFRLYVRSLADGRMHPADGGNEAD